MPVARAFFGNSRAMSLDSPKTHDEPVTRLEELENYFRRAEKPRAMQKVGLEHEKLLYVHASTAPVSYEGPAGVEALFRRLSAAGWQEFREHEGAPVIALTRDGRTVSLEPGGQLELSGNPFQTAREAHEENIRHLEELGPHCQALGLDMVALGHRPTGETSTMPWMPKSRYGAMRQSLGPRGKYALNMMLMTATGQVSLDWEDEADCARKVTLAARVSPLLVALYANSPLACGQPTGSMSFRSHVWTDVDPSRCGYLPSMLDGTFSYRAYLEWALDAPLLFLRRDGRYLVPRATFRQLLKEGHDGKPATMSDWVDHCSTLFPEVRIKQLLEIRAADCVGRDLTGALPALCRGLFYDAAALEEASRLLPRLSFEAHLELARVARTEGLRGQFQNRPLAQWAEELLGIARRGLVNLDADDAFLLNPLFEQVATGGSPAEETLRSWASASSPEEFLRSHRL